MEFTFGPLLHSLTPRRVITEADYLALSGARDILLAVLEIEDNFSCLIENFLEFEREVLGIAARCCVFHDFSPESIRRDRLALSRRLANVLATARSFLDQLDRTFKYRFPDVREPLQATCHTQYDQRLSYRVMEEIRHVVTHKGRGLHGLVYPHRRTEYGLEVRVVPVLFTSNLGELGVKKRVLVELSASGDRHAVGQMLRDYVEGLGSVLGRARELSEPALANALQTFDTWLTTGEAVWGKQPGFDVQRHAGDAASKPDSFQVVSEFLGTCRRARAEQYHLGNL